MKNDEYDAGKEYWKKKQIIWKGLLYQVRKDIAKNFKVPVEEITINEKTCIIRHNGKKIGVFDGGV